MTELTVTSAMELSETIRQRIEEPFSALLKDKVSVRYLIDESLLGGIVVFDGNRVYDGSVLTKLKNLKDELHG